MPAQTRGFLFCDLRGYSAYTDAHGDRAARELLAAYRATVREVIGSFEGSEIRTEGDSFYVVFGSVSNSVEAGLGILAALETASRDRPETPIHAGVGVHAGEAEDTSEGIVSGAVNIAARICAIAQPGELLVSDTVRALVRGYLDVGFASHGERRLKGIAEPIRLYRVTRTPVEPSAGGRRGPTRRWAMVAAIGVGAGVVLAAAAIVGGTLMNESVARSTTSPSAATGPSGSPRAAGSGVPTSDLQALLDRLPAAIAATCVPADPDEVPTWEGGDGALKMLPHSAAVRCPVEGGIDAFFYATMDVSQPLETLYGYAGRRGIREGSCDGGGDAAIARWTFGPAEGWLLCSDDAFWTYDGSKILGRANGGTSAAATLAWWRDHARFPAD